MSKEIDQITDYQTEVVKESLIEQYTDSVKLQGILDGKSEQANDLETALFEIRDEFYLESAAGDQLDIIGKVWDVDRAGLSDIAYREAISFKVSLKISGTIPELISILKSFYGATYVEYYPQYPAKYLLLTDADIGVTNLVKINPAGVGVIIKDKDDPTIKVFGFHADGTDSRFALTYELDFIQPYA